MAATASSFRPKGPARKLSFSTLAAAAQYDPSSSASASTASHTLTMSPPPVPGTLQRTASSSADGGIGPALLAGRGATCVQNGAPMAANTMTNKPAVAGAGLYGSCIVLRERLCCVPGFAERYLSEEATARLQQAGILSGTSQAEAAGANDPVTQLISVFRLGTPLCELYNLANPASPLPVDVSESSVTANVCKKYVAKFIMALQHEMGFDPDEMFTVMQVYRESTNDWVQVVRVVSRLVDHLEEAGILLQSERAALVEVNQKPSDDRAWIVRELLESERKYVQDLEVLQSCAKALQQYDILSPDRLHDLFSNLNNLVDFQRKCLIALEDNARKPPDEQRFGRVFQVLESNFDVYWPFTSNYARAIEVVSQEAANIQRLKGLPGTESCYLDPAYELPAFLIKPVQRICKYPLLLEQLLKKSDSKGPYYEELRQGHAIVQRGAIQVNEVRREQENIQLVKDLDSRVEDWKTHKPELFGPLHLSENFVVAKGETEKEYVVYLFQKILLCCKEVLPVPTKKSSKSNSLLKQKTNSLSQRKPRTTLQLKGRIFVYNITSCIAGPAHFPSGTSPHSLTVQWDGDNGVESFTLRCKNEEQMKQWHTMTSKLIDEASQQKERELQGYAPVNMTGTGAGWNGRRNTGPGSMFPQTPLSENGQQVYPFSRTDSQMSHYRYGEEGLNCGENGQGQQSGRATPSGLARFSTPAEQRERQLSLSSETVKPRARTEDQDSSVLQQWRSNSPAVPPPLPRQSSTGSGTSGEHSLIKTPSGRNLRGNGERSASSAAHPRLPRTGGSEFSPTSTPNDSSDHLPEQIERMQMGRHRGDSTTAFPPRHMLRTGSSESALAMSSRNRSASASQASPSAHLHANAPPLPRSQHPHVQQPGSSKEQLHINTAYQVRQTALLNSANGGPTSSTREGYKRNSGQRYSGSSSATSDSNQSGTSRPGSTAASSPLTISGSSGGGSLPKAGNTGTTAAPNIPQRSGSHGHGHGRSTNGTPARSGSPTSNGNAVRIQLHYNGDVYVLIVLANVSFNSLMEKVANKIHFCSGNKSISEGSLRLRYIDEDGDKITMRDSDDVQMAVENSRASGADVEIYVS